jgi:hypothetical protein
MGLPGKPDGMTGEEVEKYYRDGHIGEIADYCESDVVMLIACGYDTNCSVGDYLMLGFRRVRRTLWSLSKREGLPLVAPSLSDLRKQRQWHFSRVG